MQGNIVKGVYFFFQGLRLIFSPGFKRFIIAPILINLILLGAIFGFAAHYLHTLFSGRDSTVWYMIFLGWLIWLLFWLMSLIVCIFLFTVLTNIIASPFYGLLAEKTEKYHSKTMIDSSISVWRLLPHILMRELKKLLHFLPWLILCLIVFLIPFTTPFAPLVWILVLAWIMGVQYIDYVADNQHIPLKQMITELKKIPLTILGFGGIVILAMTIPGANLIVPPAAVAGGTLLWINLFPKK